MRIKLAMVIFSLALSFSTLAADVNCSKPNGINTSLSISIVDNGKKLDGVSLKKLVHTVKRDTGSEETTLLNSLACDIEEGSIICFHKKTADKFFLLADQKIEKSYNLALIAQTDKVKKTAEELGIDLEDSELGKVFAITGLECKIK